MAIEPSGKLHHSDNMSVLDMGIDLSFMKKYINQRIIFHERDPETGEVQSGIRRLMAVEFNEDYECWDFWLA